MTTIELARLVREMREAQKLYFAARRKGLAGSAELELSKRTEKRLDVAVKEILDDQPAMLPGMGGP